MKCVEFIKVNREGPGKIAWMFIHFLFNDTSTLLGHSVSSPREREKREEELIEGKKREIEKDEEKENMRKSV